MSFRLLLLVALSLSARTIEAQNGVRLIEIHSGWSGSGTPESAVVTIRWKDGAFVSDDKPVDAAQVQALVAALEAPRIAEPNMENLGINSEWLKAHVASQQPRVPGQTSGSTERQMELFRTSFTDPELIAKVTPHLFTTTRLFDNPFIKVEVVLEDGSKLVAESHSYYVYMLPWSLDGQKDKDYNARISRAVSALLPSKTANKERLAGKDLLQELVDAVMRSIETEWNLRGSEALAEEALAALRTKYGVTASEINLYHNIEYGTAIHSGEPEEMNLHATVRKSSFPPNVTNVVVLRCVEGKVEGVEEFVKTVGKYEDLALSVPWLNEYIQEHPSVPVRIAYVHDMSFGEKAMRTFTADMKARGREDLVEEVRLQQSQIVLLMIGNTYAEAYWLLFPDKHMMLWRYGGSSGLLKWTSADFPPGQCGTYQNPNGGCSGQEITPDGAVAAKPAPRDQVCMAQYRTTHTAGAPPSDELFPVMDHDRAGFIDHTGKVIIPLCFDKVGAFSEGLARFERDNSWGYIDASGSVVIEPRFHWAEEFSEGLARVQVTGMSLEHDGVLGFLKDNKGWGFIDKTGKIVISPVYEGTSRVKRIIGSDDQDGAFHDGLAKIEVEGKTGYIDKSGEVVIPAVFTRASPFSEGLAAATKSTTGDEDWGPFNKTVEVAIPPVLFIQADSSAKGLADATKSTTGDDGWGYLDRTGKWVIPPKFEFATSFQENLAPANRSHSCGYIDATGAYVLRPRASPGENDCATVSGDFVEGLSRWKFGNKYGFIDHSGKVVIKPRFELTFHFSEGLAAVKIKGKLGYVNKKGKAVIKPRALVRAGDFHHGLALVTTEDGRWGYIDRSGSYVWTPTFLSND